MKFQADASTGNAITGYGEGWVSVNGQRFTHSLLVGPAVLAPWRCPDFAALQTGHFEELAALDPELVIFGSGPLLRFPPPVLLSSLYARRIGVETMDTQAACRTYNFLVGEGRRAVAALLIG
ncbi:MAG: hypothetical protein EBR89_11830 [Betaproteobacteria bacterium]|nr:hypothetical protein [Betaproteobacteria bacterium]